MLHNNLGGQGDDDDDATSPSQVPGCEGLTKTDDCSKAMSALALSTQSPEGLSPASPCTSRRACAVFGNVTGISDAFRVTGSVGVPINMWVETTTPYQKAGSGTNYMRKENGVPTFGEINLAGAGTDGETSSM